MSSDSSQVLGTQRFGIEIPTTLGKLVEFMEERLKCSICLSFVNNPQRLPCNHIYCKECLQSAIKHSKQCPECRSKFIPRQAKLVQSLGELSQELSHLLPLLKDFDKHHQLPSSLFDKENRPPIEQDFHDNLVSSVKSEAFHPPPIASSHPLDTPKSLLKFTNNENHSPTSSPPIVKRSSKENYKKSVSFTEDALNMMEMNTDDMLANSQILSQLDNLINYVETKKNTVEELSTDDIFDQLTLSPCAYIHESLRDIKLSIRHESALSIVDYVVIPYSATPHTYLLECMLSVVNKCPLLQYKTDSTLDLTSGIHVELNISTLINKIIVYTQKDILLTYIVEALKGIHLDHYPHRELANEYKVITLESIHDMGQFITIKE